VLFRLPAAWAESTDPTNAISPSVRALASLTWADARSAKDVSSFAEPSRADLLRTTSTFTATPFRAFRSS